MTKSDTTQAAVFTGAGNVIEIRTVARPQLQAGEALVRVTCCTICGSDLHTFTGARPTPLPTVLGHEIIGVVEKISDGVVTTVGGERLAIGDRVTWSVAASCGNCSRCSGGIPQKCDSLFKYGHEKLIPQAELSGGLAQHCVLQPGTGIVKLPDMISDEAACPASCATATVGAALRAAGDVSNKATVVFGAGMLGLTAAAMLNAAGASKICVCDVNESRLRRAVEFGATQTCTEVKESQFDVAFEMSGNATAVSDAVNSAGIGGTVVLVGSVSPGPAVSVDPERIVRRLLTIRGVHNYTPDDLQTAVQFLERYHSEFPFAELVEKTFALTEVNEAFAFASLNRPVRVAVVP